MVPNIIKDIPASAVLIRILYILYIMTGHLLIYDIIADNILLKSKFGFMILGLWNAYAR